MCVLCEKINLGQEKSAEKCSKIKKTREINKELSKKGHRDGKR